MDTTGEDLMDIRKCYNKGGNHITYAGKRAGEDFYKYGHAFVSITIVHTNNKEFPNYERVKQVLCQDCMCIFDIEEIAKRHYDEKNSAQQQK